MRAPIDYDEGTAYDHWLCANLTDLQESWAVMGEVEKYEEGGDFPTFCQNQYDNSL